MKQAVTLTNSVAETYTTESYRRFNQDEGQTQKITIFFLLDDKKYTCNRSVIIS